MKRVFFTCLLVFLLAQGVEAKSSNTLVPYTPYNPYNIYDEMQPLREDSSIEYPKVDLAEKKLLGRTYKNEDITRRLARLETKIFGKTFANEDLAQRTENIFQNADIHEITKFSMSELSKTEKEILSKNYPKDRLEARISRMEKQLFGAEQMGSLDERFEILQNAIRYNANAQDVPQTIVKQMPTFSYSMPTYVSTPRARMTSIFKNIGSYFTEPMITGFSPNIIYPNNIPYTPYHNYVPHTFHRGFNHPHFHPGHHFGHGSTVNILKN